MQWAPGKHGSTFGGNPVACAAALATLDLVERELADNATARGDQLLAGMGELQQREPLITEVRGRGLMIGFDLTSHEDAYAVEQACFERGLLVLTCGYRGVRLAPPLVVSEEELDGFVAALPSILDAAQEAEAAS